MPKSRSKNSIVKNAAIPPRHSNKERKRPANGAIQTNSNAGNMYKKEQPMHCKTR